jgi:cytochrome P450
MPVPLTVMCWLLGTPVDDLPLFRSWVLPVAEAVTYAKGAVDARVIDAQRAFRSYFLEHITTRRDAIEGGRDVPDDLLTRLLTVERDGVKITDFQVLGFCGFLLVAGSATTTVLIGNIVHRLLEHPDQLELVRADPALIPNAVEESCRFDAPVHGLFRTSTCPVTMHGVDVPEGMKTLLLFGSANRDPEAWDDPDRFDITRDLQLLRRNYAFGHGIHYCLGAPLARLEASIALDAVLARLPGIRPNGAPTPIQAAVLHGFESYPIAWDVV